MLSSITGHLLKRCADKTLVKTITTDTVVILFIISSIQCWQKDRNTKRPKREFNIVMFITKWTKTTKRWQKGQQRQQLNNTPGKAGKWCAIIKKPPYLVSEIFGLVTDMLVVSFKVFGSCLWLWTNKGSNDEACSLQSPIWSNLIQGLQCHRQRCQCGECTPLHQVNSTF